MSPIQSSLCLPDRQNSAIVEVTISRILSVDICSDYIHIYRRRTRNSQPQRVVSPRENSKFSTASLLAEMHKGHTTRLLRDLFLSRATKPAGGLVLARPPALSHALPRLTVHLAQVLPLATLAVLSGVCDFAQWRDDAVSYTHLTLPTKA